jgi:anti-sigma B factor antagonist
MTALEFSMREEGTTVTVSVTGELDIATRPAFETYLDEILGAGPGQVILDVSGLCFIDAAGLGALASLRSRAGHQHMPLLLTGVSARMLQLIGIVGLTDHILVPPYPRPAMTRPPAPSGRVLQGGP